MKLYLFILTMALSWVHSFEISRSDFEGTKLVDVGSLKACWMNTDDNIVMPGGSRILVNSLDSIFDISGSIQNVNSWHFYKDTVYVGDRNGKIVKFHNEQRIETLPLLPAEDVVSAIVVDPSDGSVIAEGVFSGTVKLVNGEWERIGTSTRANEMMFHSGKLWSAGGGFYLYGSDEWYKANNLELNRLDVIDEETVVAIGLVGNLYFLSTDSVYKNFVNDSNFQYRVGAAYADSNGLVWFGGFDEPSIYIYDFNGDSLVASVDSLMFGDQGEDAGMIQFLTDSQGDIHVCGERWLWKYTGTEHLLKVDTSTSSLFNLQSQSNLHLADQGNHWSVLGLEASRVQSVQLVSINGQTQTLTATQSSPGVTRIEKSGISRGVSYLNINVEGQVIRFRHVQD